MDRVDCGRFAEMLDDIEEALNAQEVFQELFETQMVAQGVHKALPDSLISH